MLALVVGFAQGGDFGTRLGDEAVEEGALAHAAVAAEEGGLAEEVGEEGVLGRAIGRAFGSARLHT